MTMSGHASPLNTGASGRARLMAGRMTPQSRWIWLLAGFLLYALLNTLRQPWQSQKAVQARRQHTENSTTASASNKSSTSGGGEPHRGGRAKPQGISGYALPDIVATLQQPVFGNSTADYSATSSAKFGSWGDDFVAAFPSAAHRSALIRGSRAWRKGMRTVISIDVLNSHALSNLPTCKANRETYAFYPNDVPRRSFYEGDSRAALAPFVAYQHLGPTFKWLLYGDDDTVFLQRGVKRLLEQLDPEMPYFITDHLWFTYPGYGAHPADEAPRCLPCGWTGPTTQVREDYVTPAYTAPIGCPCRPELLCNKSILAADAKGIWRGSCVHAPVYSFPQQLYSMHGGAGAIISVGLLKRVNLTTMEACVLSKSSTGGDSFITECLWEQGYAITDPGFSFVNPRVRLFDPTDARTTQLIMALYDAARGSKQCPRCKEHLEHLATMHVASRNFHTFEDATMYIEMVSDLYDEIGGRGKRNESTADATVARSSKARRLLH